MENQKRNKIILSCLICSIMAFGIFFALDENKKINENKASVIDLYNNELKKLKYDIDGEMIDTYIDTAKGNVISDDKAIDTSEVITKTITYLDDYFADENSVSLKKVEEDKDLSLYKLQFKIGDKVSEFYVTKDGEKIFMGDFLSMNKIKDIEILGGFFERDIDLKLIDGKIPLYFYGVSSCPHSIWQYEIISAIKGKFGKDIIIYDYMDSDKEENYFFNYSDGSMPLIVIADKYFRVGSGEKIGKEVDINAISSIICQIQNLNACR